MCGISGLYRKKKRISNDIELVQAMSKSMVHRGPDAEGVWSDGEVHLSHRRLSIIDRSEISNQPMISSDGRYIIVYNGEIYNYLEIRNNIEPQGCFFNTLGDTEVILEAFRLFGTKCFEMFNGMWAIAIYDKEDKKLYLCRDRFGVKPLYLVDNDELFIFSSEMGAILSVFPQYRTPNKRSIYRYLVDGINEDSDDSTFYRDIKTFPAAHYMIVDIKNKSYKKEKYWGVDIDSFKGKWIKGKNPYKTFRELFESAVSLRLRSDVEVGVCLSGGLDSSSILGCAASISSRPIQTFSSVYEDQDCNEEEFINEVNRKWNTISHIVKPDEDEGKFVEHLKKIIIHHGQPVNGASLYSQYKVMEKAGDTVRVVLDGQGADELFAGYLYYYSYFVRDLLNKGNFISKMNAIKILVALKKYWPDMLRSIGTDDIVRAVGVRKSFEFQDNKQLNRSLNERRMNFFTDAFLKEAADNPLNKEWAIACESELNTKLCCDLLRDSIPSLLHNEDANSMAFSVESRIPFLDYRIVEFSIALDEKYKIKNAWTKWIIRKSLRCYLPEKVVKRRNKMGFPAPFARWLRTGKCREKYKEIIYQFANRGIVPATTINGIYSAHIEGSADYSDILFRYMCIELWFQEIVDQPKKLSFSKVGR